MELECLLPRGGGPLEVGFGSVNGLNLVIQGGVTPADSPVQHGGHAMEWNNDIGQCGLDDSLWHSIDRTVFWMLGRDESASLLDFSATLRSISPHSR